MNLQMYCDRRNRLLNEMSQSSALIIFSAPEVIRSADTEYPFRQNSDFWYLTGFNEPDAALLLLKDSHGCTSTILFNRSKDPNVEVWSGKRLGQQAAVQVLNVTQALPFNEIEKQLVSLLVSINTLYHVRALYYYADAIMTNVSNELQKNARLDYQSPTTIIDWRPLVHEMRLIKSTDEISVIKKACHIAAIAHRRAMKTCRPGLFEYHLEGEILHEFNRHGARYPAYNTIVGSGENACILHYTENNSLLQAGDLVLIDAGCEYQGYAADITRTFPVNGRFTSAQKALYDIVLAAQLAAIANLIPGSSLKQATEIVVHIIVEGLVKLKILKGETDTLIKQKAYRPYFMHGLGHWLGLDVHDVGSYKTSKRDRLLEEGMVLTVEPGLYIPSVAPVPEQFRGIGIRIEDNIVITHDGNEVITKDVVKDPTEIEALMAEHGKNEF